MNNLKSENMHSTILRLSVESRKRQKLEYSVRNIFNRFKESLNIQEDGLKSFRKESLSISDGNQCFSFDELYLQEIKTVDYYYRKYAMNKNINDVLDFHEMKKLSELITKYEVFIRGNLVEHKGWLDLKDHITYLEGSGI